MSGFSSMNDDYERIQEAALSGGLDDSEIEGTETSIDQCGCCEWCPEELDNCTHNRCEDCEECIYACECKRCSTCEELLSECECDDCECDVCNAGPTH